MDKESTALLPLGLKALENFKAGQAKVLEEIKMEQNGKLRRLCLISFKLPAKISKTQKEGYLVVASKGNHHLPKCINLNLQHCKKVLDRIQKNILKNQGTLYQESIAVLDI